MNYSVSNGNAQTLEQCNSHFFQTLCNVKNKDNPKYDEININNPDNAIKAFFFYDIKAVFNLSKYEDELRWFYDNVPNMEDKEDRFSLYYFDFRTVSAFQSEELKRTPAPYLPEFYEDDDSTIQIPAAYTFTMADSLFPTFSIPYKAYYALSNGGSLSSVWDLCQARYVDLGNEKTLWMGWTGDKTEFPINATDGMVECWYNDRVHGLIKTDYHNSYGQNDIIPTPSNMAGGILLEIKTDLFDYSDGSTTIKNASADYSHPEPEQFVSPSDYTHILLNRSDIVTIDDALEMWQNDICKPMIENYCEWSDLVSPPYFCKKAVYKPWMEVIALSLSPTIIAYLVLLFTFLFMMKCGAGASGGTINIELGQKEKKKKNWFRIN